MNEDYIEKLVSDIQQYLREEEEGRQIAPHEPSDIAVPPSKGKRHRILVGLMMLLSACAIGSITVAILLLGLIGNATKNPIDIMALLAMGGCGIFFSTMLVSVWKRLLLLQQIEKNTRQILESKQRANALLEYFVQNMN